MQNIFLIVQTQQKRFELEIDQIVNGIDQIVNGIDQIVNEGLKN